MSCDSDIKIIKVVQLRWPTHVSRIDDGKPADILTVGKPKERRG
jgi:hypothetical protein